MSEISESVPSDSPICIRPCESFEEFDACVSLQLEVWGFEDRDVVPRRALIVARHIGGQVIGAFDTSLPGAGSRGDAKSLIGFAVALPGIKHSSASQDAGTPYLHSHMLAVEPKYRNRGVGRRLKLAQRQNALARGITRMEWTFDPLEIKNAFLNIAKLGAIVRRYLPNLYGVSSSRLQGTLPSDRLLAEWWMDSPRVRAAVNAKDCPLPRVEQRIVVPHTVHRWKKNPEERELALQTQQQNRRHFEEAFASGLAILGFCIDADGNGTYELGRWEDLVDRHGLDTTTGIRRYA